MSFGSPDTSTYQPSDLKSRATHSVLRPIGLRECQDWAHAAFFVCSAPQVEYPVASGVERFLFVRPSSVSQGVANKEICQPYESPFPIFSFLHHRLLPSLCPILYPTNSLHFITYLTTSLITSLAQILYQTRVFRELRNVQEVS